MQQDQQNILADIARENYQRMQALRSAASFLPETEMETKAALHSLAEAYEFAYKAAGERATQIAEAREAVAKARKATDALDLSKPFAGV